MRVLSGHRATSQPERATGGSRGGHHLQETVLDPIVKNGIERCFIFEARRGGLKQRLSFSRHSLLPYT